MSVVRVRVRPRWALTKALDLEDDDDFDGAEATQHEAVGYLAERNAKRGGASQIISREPQPKLCYSHLGAVVPLQTTARALGTKQTGGLCSQYSPSRAKYSPVFQPSSQGSLPVLGGVPMRTMSAGSKFLPNTPVAPHGAPAGLPYHFGQMLLEKAKEDFDAYQKAGRTERLFGADSLDAPGASSKGPKAIADGSAKPKAIADGSAKPPPAKALPA